MEFILLKSSLCLLSFITFYKVLLERTSNHQFKRYYLLCAVIISIAIPFITFIEYVEPQAVLNNLSIIPNTSEMTTTASVETINYLPLILWTIYGLGVIVFTFRFVFNLKQIFQKIKRNPKQKTYTIINVLLQDTIVPHTFFNYIFLNKTKFENKEIPKEVLLHEETHAKQKHSLDILFIEILQIIFWFHPLVYLLKRDMKLNHEFLADQAVINQGVNTAKYQNLLLAYSSHATINPMAHAINYSLIKKRFTVMKTKTSKKSLWLRSLLVFPLLGVLIYGFSTTKQIEKDIASPLELIIPEKVPVLELQQDPFKLIFNGKETNLSSLSNDFKTATKGKKSDLKINAVGAVNFELIQEIMQRLDGNLKKIRLSEDAFIEDNADYSKSEFANSNVVQQKSSPEKRLEKTKQTSHYNKIQKELLIMIQVNKITINGKPSSIKTFKDDLNAITKDWKETDYTSVKPKVYIASASQNFLNQVEHEFSKTHYSKANEGMKLIPPAPPAPPAPPVPSKASIIPPPPPPIPANATPEQKAKYTKTHEEYNRKYEVKNGEVGKRVPPPPPPIPANATPEQRKKMEAARKEAMIARKETRELAIVARKEEMTHRKKERELAMAMRREEMTLRKEERNLAMKERELAMKERQLKMERDNIPPPPPKSPLDHVIDMAKKDATFYYEGKKISSDEAIKVLKKDQDLNISTQKVNSNSPIVYITTQPVITDKNGKVITKIERLSEVKSNTKKDRHGYVDINGTTYFYSVENHKITYFNRWGKKVNEKGELIH